MAEILKKTYFLIAFCSDSRLFGFNSHVSIINRIGENCIIHDACKDTRDITAKRLHKCSSFYKLIKD